MKAFPELRRYSLSVNGHFLGELGDGVTEAGGYYSQLLQQYDAVITDSRSTILTSQEPGANQPLWVIVASDHNTPVKLTGITEDIASKTIIFTEKEMLVSPEISKNGIETVVLDQMNLNAILDYCKCRGCCSVLLDLRGSFHEGLLREGIQKNLLQKVFVELLPVWDESGGGKNSLVLLNSLEKRVKVNHLQPKTTNQSLILEGYISY
ncbi:hypothetical protein ACFE04_019121 [Oxalis oulophora]